MVEILKKSKRKQHSIEFHQLTFEKQLFLPILEAKPWKSVRLNKCKLDRRDKLTQILDRIRSSVEELTINLHGKGHPSYPENKCTSWTFPHLKVLRSAYKLPNIYFTRCTSLETLDLPRPLDDSAAWQRLLTNNRDLRELTVRVDDKLLENPSDFKFKLQKLWIMQGRRFSMEVVHSFLETQASTLESLQIDVKINQAIVVLIFKKMSRLTSLNFWSPDWTSLLPVNVTLAYFPNLKHLKCSGINDENLHSLARHAPALETLRSCFYISRLPDDNIFPNIETCEINYFENRLQEPTESYKFAALVLKEMKKYYDRLEQEEAYDEEYDFSEPEEDEEEEETSSEEDPMRWMDDYEFQEAVNELLA